MTIESQFTKFMAGELSYAAMNDLAKRLMDRTSAAYQNRRYDVAEDSESQLEAVSAAMMTHADRPKTISIKAVI